MIKKRHVGFHAPLTLAEDSRTYCDSIEARIVARNEGKKKADEAFALPGNGPKELRHVRELAAKVGPLAQRIAALEAELSVAYREYDEHAVLLWNPFTEARDFAHDYADRHDLADIQAIVAEYVYHAARATRHGSSPTPPSPIPNPPPNPSQPPV